MPTAHSLFDLSGKTALITGSSQGIGFTLARGLAEAGAAIVLNGRSADKVAAAAALQEAGASVEQSVFDVTDHDAVAQAVNELETRVGPVDILVNNAGMQYRKPLEDFEADMFDKLLQTTVASVFHVGQAVARHMIRLRAGKIINIASAVPGQ